MNWLASAQAVEKAVSLSGLSKASSCLFPCSNGYIYNSESEELGIAGANYDRLFK